MGNRLVCCDRLKYRCHSPLSHHHLSAPYHTCRILRNMSKNHSPRRPGMFSPCSQGRSTCWVTWSIPLLCLSASHATLHVCHTFWNRSPHHTSQELSPDSTWLDTSRLDTSSAPRRACRAVLFDKLDTVKMHGLDTSSVCVVSFRDLAWRAKWNFGFRPAR